MYRLAVIGRAMHDEQCPKSWSIYGHRAFDLILEQKAGEVSAAFGELLLPTYSFARHYVNGEELHPHVDRPECEVSVTVTLSCDGDPWPIYAAASLAGGDRIAGRGDREFFIGESQEFLLPVGSGLLYMGCEDVHWRRPYTGNRQDQVFLHYVRAAGPYAHRVFDGRKALSHRH